MRKSGLALALLASAELTVLSSPAFADDAAQPPPAHGKASTGWIVLGVGGALTVAGIVLDVAGLTTSSTAPGGAGDGQTTSNARTNFFWGGTALIVAGVVTGIVGTSMVVKPNEDLNRRPPDPASSPSREASSDAVGGAVAAALRATPTVSVPILGATF